MEKIVIGLGFDEAERQRAGRLYWDAFAGKLSAAFPDPNTGCQLITDALRPDRFLVARREGLIVGVCGFHEDGQGAVDAAWPRFRTRLGPLATAWALALLSLLERRYAADVLVLDGISVDPELRGMGIGSLLLDAAAARARELGISRVQLSVIDANPRAAVLYRRRGYSPVASGRLGLLRHIFGFDGHTTMQREVTG